MALRHAASAAILICICCCAGATAQQKGTDSQSTKTQKEEKSAPPMHKFGSLDVSVNWRTRVEGWNWFEANTGNSDYALWHSLLRLGIGQSSDRFAWKLEVSQPTILGLPNDAIVPGAIGQLGLGGTYYAANGNRSNNANAFVKQAFVQFKHPGSNSLKLGRFEFFDGLEIKSPDPTVATVVRTRIAHRLISNFGFTAAQRTFDGAQLAWNLGKSNVTLFAARPTRGIFQVDGMGELDVDVFYGALNVPFQSSHRASQLRVFSAGYIDHRTTVLKTDNRPQAVRAGDFGKIEIATFGADYVQVFNTTTAGKFDFLAWGAVQTGSWGALTQRAGAFVGEAGWQPPVTAWKPWISAGYSFGSGDGNPNDSTHGTFFQVLTTPRQYARLPCYNMMNNEDFYVTANLHPSEKLALRSEAHALRLAESADLWYLGGGAFQRKTFGYVGRPSNGNRAFANIADISADYQFARNFSATLYYGHAWGKGVISAIYPKDANAQFAYLETDFRF